MIDGLKAYKLWRACHLHFTNESYDIIKYKGQVKNPESAYEKMSQPLKYRFEWLARNHKDAKALCNTLIACYLSDINPVYDDKQKIRQAGISFTGRRQSLRYLLKSQLSDYLGYLQITDKELVPSADLANSNNMSCLMVMYQYGKVSPEFVLIMDFKYNFLDRWYDELIYIGFREQLLVLRKYRSLFNVQKHYEEAFGQE